MAFAAVTAVWSLSGTGRIESAGSALELESTVVERCLSGDDAAWEELVRLHSRRVYALCYRFTGKDAEAQDLTQEVFLRVYRALASFRSTEGSFATWLTRLTRNLLIDHYRRTRNERVTDSMEEQLDRGDIQVTAGKLPLPPMEIHSRNGDITLALPERAAFTLSGSTSQGEAKNEYGAPLQTQSSGRGAAIKGQTGGGSQINLSTGRGDIEIKKN